MGHTSGKDGQVDFGASSFALANTWDFDDAVDANQFGVFGGGGMKKGNTGQRALTGTVGGAYDMDAAPDYIEKLARPGRAVTLKLYIRTVAAGGARFWEIPAQITNFAPTVDGDTGVQVSWTISWQSNGSITEPS